MRIKELAVAAMSPEQRRIHDEIAAGPRGAVQGPLKVWLNSPALADRAQRLGAFCRYETALPPHLSELAILVTGRFWRAEFEWYAHARLGLEAGLDPDVIAAIRQRRLPSFKTDDERIVYEFATQLHQDHRVGEATYAEAVKAFGTVAVVDLVGILGYYTLISMTLNAFEVPLPDGVPTALD